MPSTIQPALILIALLSVVKSVYKIAISFLRFEFFGTHGTVSGTMTKSYKNNAAYNSLQTAYFGGKRGIRTLDTLSTYTRVPVVRLRPAQPSFHYWIVKTSAFKLRFYGASDGTWTRTPMTHAPQTCLSAYSSTLALSTLILYQRFTFLSSFFYKKTYFFYN